MKTNARPRNHRSGLPFPGRILRPRVPAREQPGGRALVAEGGVTAAGCGQLQCQGAEGLGEDDGFTAEPDADLAVGGLDVPEGEPAAETY